jgi:hypothetical protein
VQYFLIEWNINHGENEGEIQAALRGPAAFHAWVQTEVQGAARKRLDEELQVLSQADVIVLDQFDYGVGRTLYRNIARDLASVLGNELRLWRRVFGTEPDLPGRR